jgi:hypothetical protein
VCVLRERKRERERNEAENEKVGTDSKEEG